MLSITDQNGNAITDPNHVGNLNPFRYRGYYYDTESGFYYLMSRYYDPVTHRFINADGYFQSGGDILDANINAYCRNNPVNNYDPFGTDCICLHQRVRGSHVCQKNQLPIPAVIEITNTGSNVVTNTLTKKASSYVYNAPKPNNIGTGIYNKSVAAQLTKIEKFSSKANTIFNTVGTATSIAGVALDVGNGIYNNIKSESTWDKTVSDASVDLVISGGSAIAAGAAGSAIGALAGTVCPGVGNIVGAGAGFIIGIGIYVMTDVVSYNGKTARTWAKEGLYSLW